MPAKPSPCRDAVDDFEAGSKLHHDSPRLGRYRGEPGQYPARLLLQDAIVSTHGRGTRKVFADGTRATGASSALELERQLAQHLPAAAAAKP